MPAKRNNIMTITTSKLLDLGTQAAEAWSDCDDAMTQLNDAFGAPFEAVRDHLQRDLIVADREGLDLSCFAEATHVLSFQKLILTSLFG